MEGIEDFQFKAIDLDSEQLLLGGPDLPEKEYQGQDINDNENMEDLFNGILEETAAPSFTDANIIPSSQEEIAENFKFYASQDDLSQPKGSQAAEVAAELAKAAKAEKQRQKEKQTLYEIRKIQNIRKNIEKLRRRSEETMGKKYLGFGETKPPKKSKKKKKTMKTLKQANVSKEEKDLIQELMEYSESSVNSEVSN